jgi:hypothetical protein
MPHLDFDASRKEHQGEAITFTLAGRKLTTVPRLPFAAVADLFATDAGDHQALLRFLEDVVVDEDVPVLHEALHDKTHLLITREVDDVVNALLEEFTGRPPTQSGDSRITSSTDGSSSKDVSASPASTPTP